ncbi:arsenate-mycothiol transferase ArsC [Chryseobacterium flavum]|uniref:arsenate-mycothiol transferase ArsC n=1 Tax=Chryseobacterium flavum TaxID=415851 RepID=UPI0028A5A7DC|nr:protein-tyrosine-phosphatase [Chryseobacterium flavum]
MYPELSTTIALLKCTRIEKERRAILMPLIEYIQKKLEAGEPVNINFICTHNSRRSHLSQIWAQIAAAHYGVPEVTCYSGGTEQTAMFPKIVETLREQGCQVIELSDSENPVYAIKYDGDSLPVIGFSKRYDHPFNPVHSFAAVMTCSQADTDCPFIKGADTRIALAFEDPKISDGTPEQSAIYKERSLQIGSEMFYVFSQIQIMG